MFLLGNEMADTFTLYISFSVGLLTFTMTAINPPAWFPIVVLIAVLCMVCVAFAIAVTKWNGDRVSDEAASQAEEKHEAQSPKVIYCLRYCFLLTKKCMHNEVWGYTESFSLNKNKLEICCHILSHLSPFLILFLFSDC